MQNQQANPDLSSEPFLKLHKASFKKDLFALALILLILAIFRYRVFQNFSSLVLGGVEGDAGLYIWLLQSAAKNLFTHSWFSTSAFYPYGLSLAWSDNFLLPSFLAWPLLKARIPLPAIFNSIILFATLLNGFLTYRLAFALFGSFQAALFAGLVFLSSPFLSGHLGHPQLQFAFFIPLITLLYFRFLAKPSFCSSICIGLACSAAFLCSVYYAIFSAFCVFILLLASMLLRPRHFRIRDYFILLCGNCIGVLPALPFVLPYIKVGIAFGERALHEAYFFSANLASFFSAPAWSNLYRFTSSWSHAEANLFPGFIVYGLSAAALCHLFQAKTQREVYQALGATLLVLCISFLPGLQLASSHYIGSVGLWFLLLSFAWLIFALGSLERQLGVSHFSNRAIIASFALMALFAFILSFGPLGFPEAGDVSISPYRFFYSFFPGFSSLRAIGRIGIVFQFALIMLGTAALAWKLHEAQYFGRLDHVHCGKWGMALGLMIHAITELRRFASKHTIISLLAFAATLLALLENNIFTYPLQAVPQTPVVFETLEKIADKNDAVIVLPMTQHLDKNNRVKSWSNFATLNVNALNWALGSSYKLVNGYSGLRSKTMKELPGKTLGFPDMQALSAMKQIASLKYLVYLPSLIPTFNHNDFQTKLAKFPGLKLLSIDAAGNYLFDLEQEIELKEAFWLLTPAYNSGKLSLQLMAPKDNSTIAKVRIAEFYGIIPIQTISVPTTGDWNEYEITLSAAANPVIPRALSLEVEGAKKVYLGRTFFKDE